MKTFICISIAASMAFMPGHSIAAAQDQTESLRSCIDAGFSKLMSTHNRDYSSPQFYIVCQYRNVKNREQNETFTYYPPDGFKIVSADVDVALKSSRSSINDLSFQAQRATINLRCKGRPEADDVHDAVGVKLVGRLEYLPTVDDTKNIAKMCLKQILEHQVFGLEDIPGRACRLMVADGTSALIFARSRLTCIKLASGLLLYFAFVAAPNGAVRTLKYIWGDADGHRFRHGPTTRKTE